MIEDGKHHTVLFKISPHLLEVALLDLIVAVNAEAGH